ncbi:MAG: hypothetical protein IT259_11180 [Saprospiraceae bacterium]|nr:hypothetical protein [Saprospiraceae bacterium]
MSDILDPVKKVILRQDPRFAGHLDFETLRRLGIDHISRFSGKVWTDHNLHDPGITMLEALCFALIDLGYRTRLPFSDLLAKKEKTGRADDNFFTAAQVFTNNPLTINDFRKLLMDIDGVRNAWLEPDEFVDLHKVDGFPGSPVRLNGLYRVLIEPEDELPTPPENCHCGKSAEGHAHTFNCFQSAEVYLLHRVWETLHAHRNLCEDFQQPVLLEKEQLRLCGHIEIAPNADPEKVWTDILHRVRDFLTPEIRFYTLQELLDKGKGIEEIFEGRPLSERSAGFIDTDELEKFRLPREIRLSDVFRVVAETEGVVAVDNLQIDGWVDCCGTEGPVLHATAQAEMDIWVLQLLDGHVPRVDFYNSCLQFYKNRVALPDIRSARRLELIARYLRPSRKASVETMTPPADETKTFTRFDKQLPAGNYRPDLGDYWSIQNDFPITYGIGDGHLVEMFLPDEQLTAAQLRRKTQALQLKGYLLFFDQLLANYLAQLANLRRLFAMTPDDQRDGASRHTLFTQRLDSVPLVERLVRFYQNNFEDTGLNDGDPIALPVDAFCLQAALDVLASDETGETTLEFDYCRFQQVLSAPPDISCDPGKTFVIPHGAFGQAVRRDATSWLWQRTLADTDLSNLEVIKDACGFWFALFSPDGNLALLSRRRYATEAEARTAAGNLLIFGGLSEAYRVFSHPGEGHYSFEIVYRQKDYRDILVGLAESPETYDTRRNQFLDHLLARFSEQFSHFSALQYQKYEAETEAADHYRNDKARYLQHYDKLGRDRGRAFNLRQPVWGQPNRSGLEEKAGALAGLRDLHEDALCLTQSITKSARYAYELRDPQGQVLFRGPAQFDSAEEAGKAYAQLLKAIEQQSFTSTQGSTHRLDIFDPADGSTQSVVYAGAAHYRDQPAAALDALLGKNGNIKPEKAWRLWLKDARGEHTRQSAGGYVSAADSLRHVADFIQNKGQKNARKAEKSAAPSLVADPANPARFLDISAFQPVVERLPDEFYWFERGSQRRSAPIWASPDAARRAFLETLDGGENEGVRYLSRVGKALQVVLPGEKRGEYWLRGTAFFADENCARLSWFDWRTAAKKHDRFRVEEADNRWQVAFYDEKERLLARSRQFPSPKAAEVHLSSCLDKLNRKGLTFSQTEIEGKFFAFRAANEKGDMLLTSWRLYEQAAEAFEALEKLPAQAVQKDCYVSTGDAGNPAYTYMLRGEDGHFVAWQPEVFDSPGERDTRRKQTLAWFATWQTPLEIRAEPHRFRYRWEAAGFAKPLFESSGIFFSPDEARRDFQRQLLQFWEQTSAVKRDTDESSAGEAVKKAFDPHVFTVEPEEFDREWHFSIVLNDRQWKSEKGFDDESSALKGLDDFKRQLANARFEAIEIARKPSIRIDAGSVSVVPALAPASAEIRDQWLKELPLWQQWRSNYDQITINSERPGGQQTGAIVFPSQGEEKVWQIVKTGSPLAVRPEPNKQYKRIGECTVWYNRFCWEKHEEESTIRCDTIPPWLDLCTDGRDVTERVDQPIAPGACKSGYRFVLRSANPVFLPGFAQQLPAGTILWRSAATFDSEPEAIGAFQRDYFRVLQLANYAPNYGAGTACIGFETLPDPNATAEPCHECPAGAPLAEVPLAIQTLFSNQAQAAEYLSQLARSYPVFQTVEPEAQCDCTCKTPGCCAEAAVSHDDCAEEAPAPRYKFHLYARSLNPAGIPVGRVLWESPRCYDRAADAWADFRVLLRLLEAGNACRPVPNACSDCGFALGVPEILLEMPAIGEDTSGAALKNLFASAAHPNAFYLSADYDCNTTGELAFQFEVTTEAYLTARHPKVYFTEIEACTAKEKAAVLIRKAVDTDDWCEIVYEEEFPDLPAESLYLFKIRRIDGYTLQLRMIPESGGEPLVLLEGIERFVAPPGAGAEEINALMAGLKTRFCSLLADPEAHLRITAVDDCTPFTYELAGPTTGQRVLASHPYRYNSLTETRIAMERVKKCLFRESFYLVEHILLRPGMAGMDFCKNVDPSKCLSNQSGLVKAKPWPYPAPNWHWTQNCGFDSPFQLSNRVECKLEWLDKPRDPECPDPVQPRFYYPMTDPYSFWATVVLPGYTPRFSDPDFRSFMEEMLRREAPAHVALCIRWLGPEDICCFEALYRRWTNWLRTGQKDCPLPADCQAFESNRTERDPGCLLGEFLRTVKDCPPTATPARDASLAQCSCQPSHTVSHTTGHVCASLFVKRTFPGVQPFDPSNGPFIIDLQEQLPGIEPVDFVAPSSTTAPKSVQAADKTTKKAGKPDTPEPKIILRRAASYKTTLDDIQASEQPADMQEIIARTHHFIHFNGAIERLQPLLEQILASGDLKTLLDTLSRTAIFHALDKVALENPKQLPESARAALQSLSGYLHQSPLPVEQWLAEWDPESLSLHGQTQTPKHILEQLSDYPRQKPRPKKKS